MGRFAVADRARAVESLPVWVEAVKDLPGQNLGLAAAVLALGMQRAAAAAEDGGASNPSFPPAPARSALRDHQAAETARPVSTLTRLAR